MPIPVIVECPHCEQRLRLKAREERLGKAAGVICKNCGEKFETTFPSLEEINKEKEDRRRLRLMVEELGVELLRAIDTSPAIAAVIERIRSEGYEPFLLLNASVGLAKTEDGAKPAVHEPKPLVKDDGEVADGVFSDSDKTFGKSLRIKFD